MPTAGRRLCLLLSCSAALLSTALLTTATSGQQPTPTFRATANLVTTDMIPRDSDGRFIADLKAHEVAIYEDGVKQEMVSFVLSHGGRIYNVIEPPREPV